MVNDPVSEYVRTNDAFNSGRLNDEEVYLAALHRMDEWQPDSDLAFVRKFHATFCDGGAPTEERLNLLISQAAALIEKSAHRPVDVGAAACTESEARDREDMILLFLETLLRNASNDVVTAADWIAMAPGGDGLTPATDAHHAIIIAEEYVDELKRLALRPIAGSRQAA